MKRSPAGIFLPFLVGLILFDLLWTISLPSPLFRSAYSPLLLDRKGRLLSAQTATDGQWRLPPRGQVPRKLEIAWKLFEDKRFERHFGVDLLALDRALLDDLKARNSVSGGSTLSMQVVRLARRDEALSEGRSPPQRDLGEKFVETFLAFRLEETYSKAQIMSLFAAHAPFGGNVVGLEAAAWRSFGLSPDALSWAQAATLAVLPNSPSRIHLGKGRADLKSKRDLLLDRIARAGFLDAEDLFLAKAEPLPAVPHPLPRNAEHYLTWLNAGASALVTGRFRSTLDATLQKETTALVERDLEKLSGGVGNAACLVVDVATGQPLAYVGNATLQGREGVGWFNDMVQAPRSTGSVLKPFLYAGMLDSGQILPDALVVDIPTRIGGFVPENILKTYSGAVPAKEALARSLNVPAVRELRSYGVDRFAGLLRDLGMTTLFRPAEDYGLTLIIGGAEGSLWELTQMYSGLARRARGIEPAFPGKRGQDASLLSRGAAWLTLQALQDLHRPPEEVGWESFASSRRVSWKTGTSNGFKDAWALGTDGRFAVGVWVGNSSGEGSPELLGVLSAAPLLFNVFSLLPPSAGISRPDDDLKSVTVCADSGWPPGPDAEETKKTLAPIAAPMAPVDTYHRTVALSEDGRWRVNASNYPVAKMRFEKRFVLPPGPEWFYRRSHAGYRALPPWLGETPGQESQSPLAVLVPEENSKMYVPIELDGRPGKLIFEAAHSDPEATLYWHLDGLFLGSTVGVHRWEIRPQAGPHSLTVVDGTGHEITRRFTVLSKTSSR